ncbi:multicopper oxidase family protein [Georgenia muralis]|uniref:FtsP/CotA-like multicopper oxidase with cupredoxin domain n=1 Tax=Georgenia muralis TaxID=154117 RepID=A0A3N4Z3L7_9MICO|nr:multicopper oxidase family protein [Georgenia muralis]RPF27137.1 FtsP/CotA-like multicopper oxidase with cupredoxin domain [Georgenia muralis]
MEVTRRDLFKIGAVGGLGAVALAGPWGGTLQGKSASKLRDRNFPARYASAFYRPPVLTPYERTVDAEGAPLHKYEVSQTTGLARLVRGGLLTPVLTYNGTVPGPTISVDRGVRVNLRVRNKLPLVHPQWGHTLDTSTHLHGSASLPQFDGYANDLTYPAYKKYYQFPNHQPARTIWYHDHASHHTAHNVYSGLAAQYHIHDEAERELLPQGDFDVPLTIGDAMFEESGRLAFDDNSTSGLWGDVILVNGVAWPVMKVQPRIYRFRVLNASISRSYRFRLSTGDPVTVVATDGGLVPTARQVTSWRHAPAERYEVLIDFRRHRGRRVELRNSSNENNVDYDYTDRIMAFDVLNVEPTKTRYDAQGVLGPDPTWDTLPTTLVSSETMDLQESWSVKKRHFRLKKNDLGVWTIGDQRWDDVIASGFTQVLANPGLNDTEVWTLENSSGGWFHPVHIHLVDFKILSRNGRPAFDYEQGPKDTVYLGEGETVRLLIKFGPHEGRYMVHCHNLPHEDHDMMAQFQVGNPGYPDPNDPIEAAQCVPDDDA